jgi:hypothetical protein
MMTFLPSIYSVSALEDSNAIFLPSEWSQSVHKTSRFPEFWSTHDELYAPTLTFEQQQLQQRLALALRNSQYQYMIYNYPDNHWVLMRADWNQKCIEVYDSTNVATKKDGMKFLRALRHFVKVRLQ